MTRFYCSFLLSIAAFTLTAQTNTWVVQDGLWSQSKNWSLGIVPTDDHDVVLPAGAEVTIEDDNWQAQSVDIDQQAILNIQPDAYLWVRSWSHNGSTFRNEGHLVVEGRLVVRHAYYSNNSSGIFNSGHIDVAYGGSLELHHNNFGVENVGTVNISGNLQGNRHHQMISQHSGGSMNISSSGYVYARRIDGRVINSSAGTYINNEGRIRLAYQINGGGINIYGEFDNAPGADIWIQDAEQSAITVSGQDAHFTNTGKIRLTGSTFGSYGIYVGQHGFFYNSPWGEIEMLGTELDDSAISIAVNGELTNNGNIHVDVSGMSVAVLVHSGDLFNFGQIEVTTDGVWGIRIGNSNARLINDGGYLKVYGNDLSIMAYGDIFNQDCGIIEAKNSLRLQGGSQLSNDGYWEQIGGTVALSSPSQIVNDAVIYDPNNAFIAILSNSSFQNNGIVINRQAYTPQSGQSYYQVFEVGGTGWGYVDPYWTTSPNSGPSFSEYDLNDNRIKFGGLPYQIDNLYAEVGINGCDFRTYRIPFAGAANRPLSHEDVPPAEVLIEQIVDQKDLSPSSTTVFPNPIQSDFQLHFSSALESPAQIQLFDMSGRQLAQWTAAAEIGQMQLNRPANIPSGNYLLNILHANGEVEQQRLVFE